MLTLLVLTDFSPAADQALHYAAALAAPAGAHLSLLHVRPSLLSPAAFTAAPAELSEQQANDLLHQRLQALPAALRPSGVVVRGSLSDELSAAVRRQQAAAVVLGRPNLSGQPTGLAHSTALDLIRHLPCPLLVVPEGAAGAVPPQQVLLALDEQPLPSLPAVVGLAPLLGQATFTVGSVTAGPNPAAASQAFSNAQLAGLLEGSAFAEGRNFVHHEPAAGIARAAATLGADLLLLVARRHSLLAALFHQSVTAEVVRDTDRPVLVLPEQAG